MTALEAYRKGFLDGVNNGGGTPYQFHDQRLQDAYMLGLKTGIATKRAENELHPEE